MGRRAFVRPFEFAVALPYRSAVFAGAVPDLAAVGASAIAADKASGEAAGACDALGALAPLQLKLHMVEQLTGYNRRVASGHIILRDFTLVYLHLFCQVIRTEGLLAEEERLEGCAFAPSIYMSLPAPPR